jgi:hypothetical protein
LNENNRKKKKKHLPHGKNNARVRNDQTNIHLTNPNRKLKETQIKSNVNQLLIESGEKERFCFSAIILTLIALRLKDLLRTKLVECGWRDGMKNYCRGLLRTTFSMIRTINYTQ